MYSTHKTHHLRNLLSAISILCTLSVLSLSAQDIHDDEKILLPVTPSLSPDGSTIVFSWRHDLWSKSTDPADTAPAKRLTTHPARDITPMFSPDGNTLFFNSNREGSSQIWAKNADGSGNATQVTKHSSSNTLEHITADGKHVIYNSVRDVAGRYPYQLFKQQITGEKPEEMLFNATAKGGTLSPDGKQVLFTREGVSPYRKGYYGSQAEQIWLYDIESNTYSQPVSDTYGVHTPLWNADGTGFFYISGNGGHFNLWKHEFSSGKNTQLTQYTEDSVMFADISRDGSTIVFRMLFHFYCYDTGTGEVRKIDLHHQVDFNEESKDILIKSTKDIDFTKSGLEIVLAANGDLYAMDTILREPKQLTNTPADESNTYFAEGGKAIYYISDDGISTSIKKLTKKDASQYWWEADEVIESSLITIEDTIEYFNISPNGKMIGYATASGELFLYDKKAKTSTFITKSSRTPYMNWSPNSEWITYSLTDADFNSDIFIQPIDGSEEPVNITKHPDNEYSPAFSPDGKKLMFIGKRRGTKYDLYYVDLTAPGGEKSKRDKQLKKARDAMKKDTSYNSAVSTLKKALKNITGSSKENKKSDEETPAKDSAENTKQDDSEEDKKEDTKKEKKSKKKLDYDLEDIQKRIVSLNLKKSSPRSTFWAKDSKSILYNYGLKEKVTYSVDISTKKVTKLLDSHGTPIRYDKADNLLWLSLGTPGVVKSGNATRYSFSIQAQLKTKDFRRLLFRTIWRTMRDEFYDSHLNGKNWDAVLNKYEDIAAHAPMTEDFDRVVSMLLGELNASHCGYTTSNSDSWRSKKPWDEQMRHLGIYHEAKPDGWHVTKVLSNSPAEGALSKLEKGDIITTIDGITVNAQTNHHAVLWGQIKDRLLLEVKNTNGVIREVKLAPISFTKARSLANQDQIDANKDLVEKLSKQKLGYVNIARMNWEEFEKFEQHLYENGAGKEGLVIDVRDNSGGSTTDHILTALTQPRHAYTIARDGSPGYPQDRFIYATWTKPIVVLCNQNSFSNAEIFSHAVKTLNRGKLVGVPTAGGVISTSSRTILNTGNLRMPSRGWFMIDSGEDMELNGATPDHIVWPLPGERKNGKDTQIEKAVEVLTEVVKQEKQNKVETPPRYRSKQK